MKPRRDLPSGAVVALAGSPNVGKSTLFNRLTGLRQHTGNWAGKTVARATGVCESAARRYTLVDLPGAYSLDPRSPEEALARDFLASGEAQAVVVVCDASCLERSLALVLQILTLTRRVLVCVNLLDEARRRGIALDLPLLQKRLGVPVIGVVAREKASRRQLLDALDALLAEPEPRAVFELPPEPDEDVASAARLHAAAELCAGVVRQREGGTDWDRRIDRLLTGRLLGYPLMLALLALVFHLTIRGANVLSDALGALFARAELRLGLLLAELGAPPMLRGLLLDGAWRVLAWVVAVMLPPMAVFYAARRSRLSPSRGLQSRPAFPALPCLRQAGAHHVHGSRLQCRRGGRLSDHRLRTRASARHSHQ